MNRYFSTEVVSDAETLGGILRGIPGDWLYHIPRNSFHIAPEGRSKDFLYLSGCHPMFYFVLVAKFISTKSC